MGEPFPSRLAGFRAWHTAPPQSAQMRKLAARAMDFIGLTWMKTSAWKDFCSENVPQKVPNPLKNGYRGENKNVAEQFVP